MDAPSQPTPRQYGLVPPEIAASMSGLELLQGMIAGRFPGPPILELIGFNLVEVEKGRAVFAGVPAFKHYNPLGTVHGGYAATLLDSCMGCSVHTTLPKGTGYTTLEFKVSLVRAVTADTGPVRAEGKVINSGRRIATAEGHHDVPGLRIGEAVTQPGVALRIDLERTRLQGSGGPSISLPS